MFLKFLVRKRCGVCRKIDRRSVLGNTVATDLFISDEINFDNKFCSCSEILRIYYDPSLYLRIIQTITLIIAFISITVTLLIIRNLPEFNVDLSTVIVGYSESKGSFKSDEENKTLNQLVNKYSEAPN